MMGRTPPQSTQDTENSQSAKYAEMVESPLESLIIRMSIPSIVSLLITSIYNLADTYFVGRLGTSATGAVGIVYPLMTLILALGLMFGKGTGTLMGRQLGRRDLESARRTAAQGVVYVTVLVSVLMTGGLLCIHPLVELLGATDSMRDYAVVYARFILLTMPFKAGRYRAELHIALSGVFQTLHVWTGQRRGAEYFPGPPADVRLWNGICRSRRRHHDR